MMTWNLKCLKMIPDQSLLIRGREINSRNRKGPLPCRVILTIITSHLHLTDSLAPMVSPQWDNHSLRGSSWITEVSPTILLKTIFNLNKSSTNETMTKTAIWEIVLIRISMSDRESLQSIKTTEWARRISIFIIHQELNICYQQFNLQVSSVTQFIRGRDTHNNMLYNSKEVDRIIIWLMSIYQLKVPNP